MLTFQTRDPGYQTRCTLSEKTMKPNSKPIKCQMMKLEK